MPRVKDCFIPLVLNWNFSLYADGRRTALLHSLAAKPSVERTGLVPGMSASYTEIEPTRFHEMP